MAATNGTVIGVFQGLGWSSAFANPSALDIVQVINEGGAIVWSLNSVGTSFTNPTALQYTTGALNTYFGSSLATAFTNPSSLDLIQIYSGTGETLEQRVSSTGVVSTT